MYVRVYVHVCVCLCEPRCYSPDSDPWGPQGLCTPLYCFLGPRGLPGTCSLRRMWCFLPTLSSGSGPARDPRRATL